MNRVRGSRRGGDLALRLYGEYLVFDRRIVKRLSKTELAASQAVFQPTRGCYTDDLKVIGKPNGWREAQGVAKICYLNTSSEVVDTVAQLALPEWLLKKIHSAMPHFRERGEERKKDTDEVAEQSDDPSEDAEMHGGDGNSGEVDAPAETSSEEPRAADLSTAGMASAEESEDSASEAQYKVIVPEEDDASDRVIRGKTSPVITKIVPCEIRKGKELVTILEKLFKGWLKTSDDIGGYVESPRIDGAKVCKAAYTLQYSQLQREELDTKPKRIIVAADVSGSCSASSGMTCGICEQLTLQWPELVFIRHANGTIMDYSVDGKIHSLLVGYTWQANITWESLVDQYKIMGAILFGDADGFAHFSKLWRDLDAPTAWLDSYCCSHGVVKEAKMPTFQVDLGNGNICPAHHDNDVNCKYYSGINSPESAAVALRMYRRGH